jgi:predicted amidohydrolase
MPVGADIGCNVARICEAIERAAQQQAEILLTPEGSLSGYTHDLDQNAVADGLSRVTSIAREKGVGLALGTCFVEDDGKCYNQIRFYGPTGEYIGFHSKMLRCGSLDTPPKGEINHYAGSELRVFAWKSGLTIGGLVCNDMWANPQCTPIPDPHLSQRLSVMGAQIVFHAVSGGRDGSSWSQLVWQYHESNLRMRARAGGIWIVTVDNCHPVDLVCSAPSGVITPRGDWACRTEPMGYQFFAHTVKIAGDGQPAD